MPIETLDNLVTIGQLKAEPPQQAELDGLMHSGAARIKDAERAELSFESRFDLAYSAAHAFSLAAFPLRLSLGEPVSRVPDAAANRSAEA
jgi:hypothetical protein